MKPSTTLALTLLLAGCQAQVADVLQPPATDAVETTATPSETSTSAELELVSGLVIDKVSSYQAVESVLWEDGDAPTTLEAPIVAQREALLRVFVRTKNSWEPRRVMAVLTLDTNGDQTVLESKTRIEDNSKNNDLDSTFNFEIDGDLIKRATEFKVELFENNLDNPGGGDAQDVVWDSTEEVDLDIIQSDTLELVLIPVRYNADGSGRMPDTSQAQLDRIQELAYGMYPASEVVVRVGPTLDWNRTIEPFDSRDWTDVLDSVGRMRDGANETPNTYYYGVFEPEASLNDFCRQGCILGLSLLSWTAADPYLRASVGIGYTGITSAETLVHEIGHAHGREHAPCGLYGQPSDSRYPYSDGTIGSWGYDVVNSELLGPNTTVDMMSYCNPIWVSDYTYYELLTRMLEVKAQPRSLTAEMPAVSIGPDGSMERRAPVPVSRLEGATPVQVAIHDTEGVYVEEQPAHLFPYSHFDGGLVILSEDLPLGWTAELLD